MRTAEPQKPGVRRGPSARLRGGLGPREVALWVLLDAEHGKRADAALAKALARQPLHEPDRALGMELAYGTLRWRGYLDWVLQDVADRRLDAVPAPIRNILRMAAYQLLFLERVPAGAAVNEAVELAGRYGHGGTVRFVNGVLRALGRRASLPGGRGADVAVPGMAEDPAAHISVRTAHPAWLVARWIQAFGLEETTALCQANNQVPPLHLRVNTRFLDRDALLERLRASGLSAEGGSRSPEAVCLRGAGAVEALPGYEAGWFQVQDESAQLVAWMVAPRPGERVLDLCAAPGGKATHLAQRMGDQGEVVAVDASPERLSRLQENAQRLKLSSIRTLAADGTRPVAALPEEGFQRVLVDAPCSGTGVLRRHPEGKWQKTPDLIPRMAALQRTLLAQGSRYVEPGGVLVYSTCSVEREENEDVVAAFLADHPGFTVEDPRPDLPEGARACVEAPGWLKTFPHRHGIDGSFAVRLRRRDVNIGTSCQLE